jgi:dTDP-4-dehydrorhamnose 3,5-epimerase
MMASGIGGTEVCDCKRTPPVPLGPAVIRDVQNVPLVAHVDDRGYLIEIVRATDPHLPKFGQVYLVGNFAKGTVRAFHKHLEMWDLFFISHGAAKFVLVDDRPESPTYRETNVFVISARNPSLIVVPPGVFHGWMSLEDDTQMISTATEVYRRGNPDEVRVPPDTFGDHWVVKGR